MRTTGRVSGALAAGVMATLAVMASGQHGPQPAKSAVSQPWMNAQLSPDERASLVVKAMTLDEKIQMVHGIGWGPLRAGDPVPAGNNGGAGEVLGIPRLGIPDINQADSAVGVRMAAPESRYATLNALPTLLLWKRSM